jgi:hypothetical protein
LGGKARSCYLRFGLTGEQRLECSDGICAGSERALTQFPQSLKSAHEGLRNHMANCSLVPVEGKVSPLASSQPVIMTTEQILIPAAAVLATVSLNGWINTKIKFAQDQSDAMRGIRSILLLVVFAASQLYVAVSLVLQFASNAPLNRGSLATILIGCFGLFTLFMFYWFFRLLRLIEGLRQIVARFPCVTERTPITAQTSEPSPSPQPIISSAGTSEARSDSAASRSATSPSSDCA